MRTILLLLGLLFGSMTTHAQLRERLDSLMRVINAPDKPGSALTVLLDGKLVYRQGIGQANAATKTAITPETNFRMASVTKQFTAMAILLLEKDRKLSLDDPLIRFFPELPSQVSRKVQVRNLLTHSSGLIDYEAVMNPKHTTQLLDADVLNLLKSRDTLYFEPGSQFRYSNSGYCLLALLIEQVSGQSFASFLRERIFQPLQMNQSVVYEKGKPIPHRAIGYRKQGNGFVLSDQSLTSATKGDGGVYTSLTDYQKWAEALWNNTLLDLQPALTRAEQTIRQQPGTYYGAGWFFQQPTDPVLFHSGTTCGFNNFVVLEPTKKMLVAYFSNRADNKTNAISVVNLLTNAGHPELETVLKLDALTQ